MSSLRLAAVSAVLISAVACGADYSSPPTTPSQPSNPSDGPSASITIPVGAEALGNRAFTPSELDVTVGTTVTWRNVDVETHTTTSNGTGWNSGNVAPGREFSFRFQAAGTFPYRCTIHPEMVGTVVVR